MDDIYNPWYWFSDWDNELMIGAGTHGTTICDGDSGGPLVVPASDGHPIEVGVASFGKSSCNEANAFAELSGPQLAWIASVVPEVATGWGTCTTVNGVPGRGVATYGTDVLQGPRVHGDYLWNLQCVSLDARLMKARHSGLCGNVLPDTGLFVQGTCTGIPYNMLEVSPSDDGHFRLIVAATNKCLGIDGASTSLRAKLKQMTCGSGWNQQFDLRATDSGYVEMVARHSQLCLDVQGDYVGPGAYLWQYTCDQGYNQQFLLVPPCTLKGKVSGLGCPDVEKTIKS
jgi:hypothetical protein